MIPFFLDFVTEISDDIRRRLETRDRWEATEDSKAVSAARNSSSDTMDLYKLAEIASGEDEEQLPDASSRIYRSTPAEVIQVPPRPFGAQKEKIVKEKVRKEPHGNAGATYSYLDIYTLEYLKTWMTMPSHIEDPYQIGRASCRERV